MLIFKSPDNPDQVGVGEYRYMAFFIELGVIVFYTITTEGDDAVLKSIEKPQFFNDKDRFWMQGRRQGTLVAREYVPREVVGKAIEFYGSNST